jgi:hypothetical protein
LRSLIIGGLNIESTLTKLFEDTEVTSYYRDKPHKNESFFDFGS